MVMIKANEGIDSTIGEMPGLVVFICQNSHSKHHSQYPLIRGIFNSDTCYCPYPYRCWSIVESSSYEKNKTMAIADILGHTPIIPCDISG